jgi:prepilin-type N-terminal cleavage/methylation domain-containing protein
MWSNHRRAARLNGTARDAFTLPELAIVLVIVGVLLGLAIPPLVSAADRSAVRAAIAESAAAFVVARESALHARRAAAVRVDTMAGVIRAARGGDILLSRDLRARHGVRIAATRDSMAYDPRGLGVGAANLSLVIRRGRVTDTLYVSRLGRIRW